MTHTCPYCGAKMPAPPIEQDLTAKQGEVFRAILAAGPKGVSVERLMADFYLGRSPIALRSCICNINQVIKPMKIASRNKTYSVRD